MPNFGGFRPSQGGNGGAPYQNNGGNFRNGYNNTNRAYAQRGDKKYSGCSSKPAPNGSMYVWGWMKSYGQFIKYIASVAKTKVDTKNPDVKRMVVNIQPDLGKPYLVNGFWNIKKRVLSIPDLGLVCNPGENYTYRYGRKKRR